VAATLRDVEQELRAQLLQTASSLANEEIGSLSKSTELSIIPPALLSLASVSTPLPCGDLWRCKHQGMVDSELSAHISRSDRFEVSRQFLYEAELLHRCRRHPNLPHVVGIVVEQLPLCRVYADANGPSLKDFLVKQASGANPGSSFQACHRALQQIASAMSFLEACQIVHGHLCTANIVFQTRSCSDVVVFGAASDNQGHSGSDAWRWQAPEVLASYDKASSLSDIW
jgi:serine/threonine protein kinase